MKAVILAAGKGTRMKELTREIPKPMILIKNMPMLAHIISFVKNAGINDFGVVVGYKQTVVQDYFKDGDSLGIKITYIEQTEQNGTGAALHCAKDFIKDESFLFTFGDVMTPPENYPGMINFYHKNRCDLLLGLNYIEDPYKGAAVYIDKDNNIVKMVEKPPIGTSTTNYNNSGIMILTHNVFQFTSQLKLSPRGEYELTDIFGMMKDGGYTVKGYPLSGYWKDIGTPEDLDKINSFL